jgi:hypothetical protein
MLLDSEPNVCYVSKLLAKHTRGMELIEEILLAGIDYPRICNRILMFWREEIEFYFNYFIFIVTFPYETMIYQLVGYSRKILVIFAIIGKPDQI